MRYASAADSDAHRVHAVEFINGEPDTTTVCGEPAANVTVDHDWESVTLAIRCGVCGQLTGVDGMA